jgi:hypothetical protein
MRNEGTRENNGEKRFDWLACFGAYYYGTTVAFEERGF